MVAPKGNKYAVGNPLSGRPCKFDKELEFAELEKWAKTEDALVFRMFPLLRGYSHDTLEDWAKQSEVYLDIYNIAKGMVGARRELRLVLADHATPFQRYATYYDSKLRAHEREEKELDSALKQKEEGTKATTIHLQVPHDLAAGLNLPTKTISSKNNPSTK